MLFNHQTTKRTLHLVCEVEGPVFEQSWTTEKKFVLIIFLEIIGLA